MMIFFKYIIMNAIYYFYMPLTNSNAIVQDNAEDAEDQQQFSKIKRTIRRMNLLVSSRV